MSAGNWRRHFRIQPGRLLKAIFVALAVVFFSAAIFVLWALSTGRATEIVRAELVHQLEQACGVGGEFSNLELEVFPPALHIRDLSVSSPTGRKLIAADGVIVNLSVFPLLYGRLQLERVALLRPEATLTWQDGALTDLPRCLAPKENPKKTEDSVAVPIALGVSDLQIEQGHFRFQIPGELDVSLQEISVSLSPGRTGGTDLAFGVDQGKVVHKKRDVVLDRVRVLAHIAGPLIAPRAISVERLELLFKDIELVLHEGAVDLLGPVYEAKVQLKAPLRVAKDLVDGLPAMSGQVELNGQIAGTHLDPRGSGRLTLSGAVVDAFRLGDKVIVDFRANRRRVDIEPMEIQLGAGSTEIRGHMLLDERLTTELDLDLRSMSLGLILDAIDVTGPWVDLFVSGPATFRGKLIGGDLDLGGRMDFSVENFRVFDRPYSRPELRTKSGDFVPETVLLQLPTSLVSGEWSVDPDALWFRNQTVLTGASRATCTARLGFDSREGTRIDADVPEFNFVDVGGRVAGLELAGRGRVAARIQGPYDNIRADGDADLSGVEIAGIPFGRARSDIHWHDDYHLDFEGIQGQIGRSEYSGEVKVLIEEKTTLEIKGSVPRGRVEDLLIPFRLRAEDYGSPTGDLTEAEFSLSGEVRTLTGPIRLSATGLDVLDESFERLDVEGGLENGALVAHAFRAEKHGAVVSGSGRWDPNDGAVALHAKTRGLRLQQLDAMKRAEVEMDGAIAISIDLDGPARKALTGTVTVVNEQLRAGDLTFDGGRLDGKVSGRRLMVTGSVLGSALPVEGEIGLLSGLPYKAKLSLSDFDLPRLLGALSEHPEWRGSVSAVAELEGKLSDWADSTGTVQLERARVSAGSLELETVGSARLGLRRGELSTRRLVVAGAATRMTLAGSLGRRQNDLKVQGRLDLALLESLFKPVERSGGVLNVNAVVRGSADRLDLVGTGRIERGVLQWRGLPSRLTGAVGQLTFSQNTVLLSGLEGRYAGGAMRASGQVLLKGFSPSNVSLDLKLEDVRPNFRQPGFDLSGVIDGKLRFEGTPDKLLLRGSVNVQQGRYRPKFDWSKIVADTSKRLLVDVYDPSAEVLSYDIDVHLDPLARLKNETVDVEVSGDLRMVGTNQRMGLLGSLAVLRGRVGFFGRAYDIRGGGVEFSERYSIQPRYDLSLRARACEATIDVNVAGTLDAFQTNYVSNPEMDESSIVSCLKFGVRLEDAGLFAGGGGSRLGDDAGTQQMLGLGVEALWRLSGVDQQVRRVIPVDQIEVTTEYSSRLRVYEPRLVVGKDLGFVQLQASSSLTQVDTLNQAAVARFRLTPDLSLELSWQYSQFVPAVGDLGVDLKRRWEW